VATLVAIAVRRIRLPCTVALVLVGLFIAIRRPLDIEVTPELILTLFVPPLVFEAAFHLDFRLLRDDLPHPDAGCAWMTLCWSLWGLRLR